MLFLLCSIGLFNANARVIKVTTTPMEAKIYVDGQYVADGMVEHQCYTREGFIAVKVECVGYVTQEIRIPTKGTNSRHITLREDMAFTDSSLSGNANKFFSVTVNEKLYTRNADGKIDMSLAWKMIHQVLLGYFEEIQSSDMLSGFVQTPWVYKSFPTSENQVRTRVTIKESNLGGEPTFQIKISSELGPIGTTKSERFRAFDRILKQYESLINEFQARVGQN